LNNSNSVIPAWISACIAGNNRRMNNERTCEAMGRLERSGRPAGRLVVIKRAASMSDDEAIRRLNFSSLPADTLILLQRFSRTDDLPRLIR